MLRQYCVAETHGARQEGETEKPPPPLTTTPPSRERKAQGVKTSTMLNASVKLKPRVFGVENSSQICLWVEGQDSGSRETRGRSRQN